MLVNCFIGNDPVKVDLTIEQAKKRQELNATSHLPKRFHQSYIACTQQTII
jgi:hypothetical protein